MISAYYIIGSKTDLTDCEKILSVYCEMNLTKGLNIEVADRGCNFIISMRRLFLRFSPFLHKGKNGGICNSDPGIFQSEI